MNLTDLRELKVMLDIAQGDTVEDAKLLLLIERASGWIEEILDRKLGIAQVTEYYNGTGTQLLPLRKRPVYKDANNDITVYANEGGAYGSATDAFASTTQLTYGTDFCLEFDQEETGVSRGGILVRLNNIWQRPPLRERGWLSPYVGPAFGNIKVTYTAGFTEQNVPSLIRSECNALVARMRNLYPLGSVLNSESYEERSVSYSVDDAKDFLIGPTRKALAGAFRNTWFASR